MRVFATGEVCKLLKIQQETLAYWERTGKVPAATRLGNGKKIFTIKDVRRLRRRIIDAQKTLGRGV